MNVFSHKSSKSVLSTLISTRPNRGRGEVSRIAQHLGVSTTIVSHALSGQKILTLEQAESLITYFGFSALEADYFIYLVQLERAGTKSLKAFWTQKLERVRDQNLQLSNRVESDRKLSDVEKSIFYSTPLYSAIHLFTTLSESGKTLDEIAVRFELEKSKALEMVEFLLTAQLLKLLNGRYVPGVQKTHLEHNSPHLLKHHANWRIRAIRQSEDLTKEELMYTAPVSLSVEDFKNLREEMAKFITSFLDRVHASPAEEIACFTMDWFWIRK